MDSNLNQLAPITDFDKAYILAQQALENGFRGTTFPELYTWLKGKLDLTGLSNTAGLPEDFPEPGSTLEATNPQNWTILGPGTYNKVISGTITIPSDEFGFTQFDGVDFNRVLRVKIPSPPLSNTIDQTTDKAVTPKGVDDAIGTIKVKTSQLLDKSTFVYGYYDADGNPQSSTATIRTTKMKLQAGQNKLSISNAFVLGASVLYRVFFYNALGAKLPDPEGRISASVTDLANLDIPSGADTWAMNIVTEAGLGSATDNKYSNSIMANYGATIKAYEPFGYNLVGNNITALNESVNKTSSMFTSGKNLIDKSKVTYGYWNNTGGRTTSTTTISTEKIPIKFISGQQEMLSLNKSYALGITYRFVFWDANGVFISVVGTDQPINGVPIPSNAGFVGVNIISKTGGVGNATDNEYVNGLQLEYGAVSTTYETFGDKVKSSAIPSSKNIGVSITVVSVDSFFVTVYYDNGKIALHHWLKNNKAPQYDTAWRATEIEVDGANIAQGQFNWIHMTAFPNEGQHVGTGHGCETLLRAKFYIDGKEVVLADNIGKTISGTIFHFDIATVMYAADSAETTANWNGANVVPQLPLIESTKHYMIGEIRKNGFTANYNKLVPLRNGTQFGRCYGAMQNAYRTHFDRLEIRNIENTMNDIQTLTPIGDSTASLQGLSFDTAEGWRGELAQEAIAYSDRFNYVLKTRIFAKTEKQRLQTTIQVEPTTSKCYFHPVITTSLASLRGLSADTFNKGDIIECYVERELII